MDCKHKYFLRIEGLLRCSVCGTSAADVKNPPIEDKVAISHETKIHQAEKKTSPKRVTK